LSENFKGWISKINSITLNDIIKDLENNPHTGAITTFTGIVRKNSDYTDKQVVAMEVEAWEEQTTKSMTNIATRIGEKHNLLGLRIVHLEGEIKLGEPIVFIVIASIHRKEAFAALEESINAYKQESPVWKKEIYDDGSGNWIKTAQ
jgi:molybdopterin synthase catalytic subunit